MLIPLVWISCVFIGKFYIVTNSFYRNFCRVYFLNILFFSFGSSTLSTKNDSLACPKIRWLGIHPSELSVLGVKISSLSERDLSKLTSINSRHYMTETLLRQTRIMRRGKAEIEAVSSFCRNFLTATYISRKIKGNDYI